MVLGWLTIANGYQMTALWKMPRGRFLSLEFSAIEHRFGQSLVLRGINLRAEPGEITCLLGPSGCGKTTLLRLASGVYDLQAGSLTLNGEVLAAPGNNPPPERRPVGLVFQEGALFPHLSVEANVCFGMSGEGAKARAKALLEQVGLADFAGAFPHTLSGGQQQRVALARALAPKPPVLLLDEPFASVDVVQRQRLREETRRILKAQGSIAVLVTHDPEEAMDVGDRIALMDGGEIVQQGAPAEIYDAPASASVAEFFGGGQRFAAKRDEAGVATPFGLWPAEAFQSNLPEGGNVEVVARPEALTIAPGEGATVEDVRPFGRMLKVFVTNAQGDRLAALTDRSAEPVAGARVEIFPQPGGVFCFPAE